jgi:hypothetical protein
MATQVSKQLLKDMEHNVQIVKDGQKTFIYVGEALRKLRDDGLYKAKYKTFEELCKAEFQYSKGYSYRLIEAASVVTDVNKVVNKKSPIGDKSVTIELKESHARALVECADDSESRAKVISELEKEGVAITASSIKKKADEILPPKTNPTKDTKRPSGGTKFDPTEFDPDLAEDAPKKSKTKLPEFITAVISATEAGREILNQITQLKKKIHAFVETSAGSWINSQEADRLADQLSSDIKFCLYECPCPRCKLKPSKSCERCGGRGWLDRGHARQNTDDDKTWLEGLK